MDCWNLAHSRQHPPLPLCRWGGKAPWWFWVCLCCVCHFSLLNVVSLQCVRHTYMVYGNSETESCVSLGIARAGQKPPRGVGEPPSLVSCGHSTGLDYPVQDLGKAYVFVLGFGADFHVPSSPHLLNPVPFHCCAPIPPHSLSTEISDPATRTTAVLRCNLPARMMKMAILLLATAGITTAQQTWGAVSLSHHFASLAVLSAPPIERSCCRLLALQLKNNRCKAVSPSPRITFRIHAPLSSLSCLRMHE